MSLYETLNIANLMGYDVTIWLRDGSVHRGILDLDLVNEDWEDDGEKPALGLDVGSHIDTIYFDTIQCIVKTADVWSYAKRAV
jgi:hypothetical protein